MRTKTCSDCNNQKYISEFYSELRSSDGYKKRCKECENLRRARIKVNKLTPSQKGLFICERYWEKTYSEDYLARIFYCDKESIVQYLTQVGIYKHKSKPCASCKNLKFINDFPKGQRNFSGWCLECQRYFNKKYYLKNSEELKSRAYKYYYNNYEYSIEARRNYYYNNRSELLKNKRNYHFRNRDRLNREKALYYLDNKDRIKQNVKNWKIKNPDKKLAIGSKYRANKNNAVVAWTNFEKIDEIYRECQRLTEETGIKYSVDHIIPLNNDKVCGLHVHNNLQIIKFSENCKKNNKFTPVIGFS